MLQALELAKKAFNSNETPVGCVIVENNQIISSAHNETISNNSLLAHAEILAIQIACQKKHSSRLENCEIYITLEPCPMCLSAISFVKIKKIYYGANDLKFGAVESNPLFSLKNLALHKPEIYSGINSQESINLLTDFFKNKR